MQSGITDRNIEIQTQDLPNVMQDKQLFSHFGMQCVSDLNSFRADVMCIVRFISVLLLYKYVYLRYGCWMLKGWDARVEHVACFCEHNIESLGSIICKEVFNQLWNCQLLKKYCSPWNQLVSQLVQLVKQSVSYY